MHLPTRARGVSIMNFLLLLIAVGIAAIFGMKVGPMYLEYGNVKSAMDDLAQEQYASAGEARKSLMKRLEMNYVSSVAKEDITVTPVSGGGYDVTVMYYAEKPLVHKLSVLGTFDYTVTTQ